MLAALVFLGVFFSPAASASLPQSPAASKTEAQAANGQSVLDPERQQVLNAVIKNLQEHYFDAALARRVVDALTEHARNGDDLVPSDDEAFAATLTKQMRDASHDLHLQVIYMAKPVPQSSPEQFQRMLNDLKKDNCNFKKVEMLPQGIGYLSLMLSSIRTIAARSPPVPLPPSIPRGPSSLTFATIKGALRRWFRLSLPISSIIRSICSIQEECLRHSRGLHPLLQAVGSPISPCTSSPRTLRFLRLSNSPRT
jgi:hypothetical protein